MQITFEELKNTKTIYKPFKNTNDLINGLFVTINSTSKTFDYADAYELLSSIQKCFYETLGIEYSELRPNINAPTAHDIDLLMISGDLLSVFTIGCGRTGEKCHIHLWIYNLHSYARDYRDFATELEKGLKRLKGISSRNEFGIRLVPVEDLVDRDLRKSNYDSQVIVDYITKREYGTLMNYFSTKNNNNFVYFY